jgi:hypothetical protein
MPLLEDRLLKMKEAIKRIADEMVRVLDIKYAR